MQSVSVVAAQAAQTFHQTRSEFSVCVSSNDFLFFWCFFTEWGKVSVRGKRQPTHSTHILLNICALTGLVGTWRHFHTCLVTCVTIVTHPAIGSCSSPNTSVHLYFHASAMFHLSTWTYQSSNLGTSLICCYCVFSLYVWMHVCLALKAFMYAFVLVLFDVLFSHP